MEFVKACTRRSVRRAAAWGALCLLAGAVILGLSGGGWLFAKPRPLYEVPEAELEGAWVRVDLPIIYGVYASTEEWENGHGTGRILSREYIIDANSYSFCGLLLPEDLVADGESLLAQSDAYWLGQTAELPQSYAVTGRMERMDHESLGFYHEVVGYDDLPDGDQGRFLPLVLVAQGRRERLVTLAVIGAGLVLMAMAPVLVIPAMGGKHQRQLREKAQTLGDPELIYGRLEDLFRREKAVRGLRFDRSLVFLEQGFRQRLFDAGEICWAYQETTAHRLYGMFTIGRTQALALCTLDGQKLTVPMGQKQLLEQLQKVSETLPACVVGYSDTLAELYRSHRDQFAQMAAARSRWPQS